jgi:hypothetical protein
MIVALRRQVPTIDFLFNVMPGDLTVSPQKETA